MSATNLAPISDTDGNESVPVTLAFFYSPRSGRSRQAEGFLAQVLQHRRNHETFKLLRVDVDERADLATRFRITTIPTLVVISDKRTRARLSQPKGCREITELLAPWLR
jgi:thioredoxin-like negative regulator of GroEL